MKVKGLVLFYPLPIVIVSWYAFSMMFGMRSLGWNISLVVASYLLCLGLLVAGWNLSARVWLYAGLAALAGLFVPTASIQECFSFPPLPQFLQDFVGMVILFWPAVALIIAALLLYTSIKLFSRTRSSGVEAGSVPQEQLSLTRRQAAMSLALSGLIVAKLLHNLYWLMVWDNTNDSLENVWLILPELAAVLAGYLLVIFLPGWSKLAGPVYTALTLALMVAVSARGQQVDFRQLTDERAEKVTRAIEAYYLQKGHFPEKLSQLIPRFALTLPGAVVIYGQGWCYDGGDSYYRLGYIDREHWSSPYLNGHLFQFMGETANLPPLCEKEKADLMKKRPGRFIENVK